MIPCLRNPHLGRHSASGLIRHGDARAWGQLNVQPFAFQHSLSSHPLLSIERLARLSERAFDRDHYKRYFTPCELRVPREQLKKQFRESIEQIGENGKWVALHYIDEMDPEYADLFDLLLADIEEIIEIPVRSQMTWGSLSVFMSAPGLAVPYHFDHETNFLMQISGEKDLHLYPREHGSLTAPEIEDFYRHNPVAGIYREELEQAATAFLLKPGIGVHHPPLAPHRIRNRDDVSVSLSVYFSMPEMEERGHVYQANYCMRKLGLRPRAPGESALADGMKIKFMRALSTSHPRTHDELLYSGVSRLAAPFKWAKQLRQRA
ncbi:MULTISPECIES: cupin-like domain-containing protein [unclassified Variovorax]|uniref:cupin-like domain-containing protein n=1 Tax=unclassified Variovorax TaxID=663243 RepID=UPI0008D10A61|nr:MULTISPECIES: cupin-like domain-containing protein [unclassified Variovorax]SEK16577.1 Cupin-like domain-containing protein [Variovorax sp. OK202]SFE53084.1 Cupin-like domain-containing protein [Variovorax sp. OK212]